MSLSVEPQPQLSDADAGETISARQRVLQAAEALFLERGYKAITLKEIASALQIKQASLYYHFPGGKEALFKTVVENLMDRHREGIENAVAEAGIDLENRLRAVAHWFIKQPSINMILMMHTDMPALSGPLHESLYERAGRSIFFPVRSIFEEAVARNEIRPLSVDVMTGAFLSIIDGFKVHIMMHNSDQRPHFVVDTPDDLHNDGSHNIAKQESKPDPLSDEQLMGEMDVLITILLDGMRTS